MEHYLIHGGLPLKYQCTNRSQTHETPNVALGIYCIVFGFIVIVSSLGTAVFAASAPFQCGTSAIDMGLIHPLYVLCLSALAERDLRAMFVYKLMIFLSICDIEGVVYCTYPTLIYVLGCASNGCWNGACIACFFLISTRFINLWSKRLHDALFGGTRAIVVVIICACYGFMFFLFPSPGLFNAKYYGLIFDPMIDDGSSMFAADLSELIAINNMLTVTLTFALYFAFFFSFFYKYYLTFGYRMSSHEKQIFIQSTALSAINLTLALIYVYMLYFPAPITMIRATLFLWHFSTSGAVVIYLGVNKTVRGKVLARMTKKNTSGNISVALSFKQFHKGLADLPAHGTSMWVGAR